MREEGAGRREVHLGDLVRHPLHIGVLADAVVAEVLEDVQPFQVELLCCKSDVALLVKPNDHRVPSGHQNPLANIKLPALDDEGPFNVLLGYPLLSLSGVAVLDEAPEVVEELNAPPPRLSGRLDNPYVLATWAEQDKLVMFLGV